MAKKPKISEDPSELRRRAEQRLKIRKSRAEPDPRAADTERLLHELEVHQIELEMQNEELEFARTQLEAEVDKYTDLYDFAPVGYLTLDREGAIREANLTGASLLGGTRSALMQQPFRLLVAPADRPIFDTFLKQIFEGGKGGECDVKLVAKGRPTLEVRLRANNLVPGQTCRVALADITEHKRAEADRLILNKLESTGILAGGLAHDFNNLLTVILLDIELAQSLAPSGTTLTELLHEARKATLSASGLTRQLIIFSSGGAPMRKPTLLGNVVQESVRHALSGCNLKTACSVAEDLWLAMADEAQIGQVIHNITMNAREAMPQGGLISVRVENVTLSARQTASLPAGKYVRVSIADHGGGIAKDVLPKIFDPYFSTKEGGKQRGMGLGLTICHAIAHKHDGAIEVESEAGAGTTFHLYLPAAMTVQPEVPVARPTAVLGPARLLVMDDEAPIRKVLGQAMQKAGHQIELAANGELAIAAYQAAISQGQPFEVVILDLTVRGGMGGAATIQALIKLDPAVKAIAISGYAQDPVMLEPERHGFKAAVAKPFDVRRLQEVIAEVLGQPSGGRPGS